MAATQSETLLANAKKAIDAIVTDTSLDDDTKEEMLDELQTHLEDQGRLLSDEDDEEEDEDDEIEDGDLDE